MRPHLLVISLTTLLAGCERSTSAPTAVPTRPPIGYAVSGVVRDEGGELIPGARVTCCHDGGFSDARITTTDASGRYRIDAVSGNAHIGAYQPNYGIARDEHEIVTVSVTADLILDIKLLRRLTLQAGENVASFVAWDDSASWLGCVGGPCRVITILGPRNAGTLYARLEWDSSDQLALSIGDDDEDGGRTCCESGETVQFRYKGQTTWIYVTFSGNFKTPPAGGTIVPFTLRTTLER